MLSIGINLLLWYFVARRGSVVAKWIVVVLFGLGVVGVLRTLGSDAVAPGSGLAGMLVLALQAGAVVMLFRLDTEAWFGSTPTA